MRRVKQGDPTGCGLACIAMLAGCDYNKVRDLAVKQLCFDDSGKFHTGAKYLEKTGTAIK